MNQLEDRKKKMILIMCLKMRILHWRKRRKKKGKFLMAWKWLKELKREMISTSIQMMKMNLISKYRYRR